MSIEESKVLLIRKFSGGFYFRETSQNPPEMEQICLLTLFTKIKFSRKFLDLQYDGSDIYLQILKPMMLRRLKEDVEKNLAAKEETIIEV